MITTNDKLNSIYQTKLRIKNVIQTESDEFSEYPDLIAAAISPSGGGVSYSYLNEKLTYYVEKDELYNSSYATQSYVVDYVNTYAPTPDLSAYVSYSYLESKHYLDSIPNTYATYEAISGMGYLTSIPNDYPTYAAISEMSYATQSYVVDYVAEHGGGGGSEVTYAYLNENYLAKSGGAMTGDINSNNIIPNENNTYTLGDENHIYSATYSARLKVGNNSQIYNDSGGITLSVNSNAGIRMCSSNFYPKNNNGMNLGQSSNAWDNTYTSNLYLGSYNIKDLINGMFSYDSSTGTLTITTLS